MSHQSPLLLDELLFLLCVSWLLHLVLRLFVLVNVFVGIVIGPPHDGSGGVLNFFVEILTIPWALVSFIRLSE